MTILSQTYTKPLSGNVPSTVTGCGFTIPSTCTIVGILVTRTDTLTITKTYGSNTDSAGSGNVFVSPAGGNAVNASNNCTIYGNNNDVNACTNLIVYGDNGNYSAMSSQTVYGATTTFTTTQNHQVYNGSKVGNAKTISTNGLVTSTAGISLGANNDTWGATLTPAIVNSSSFGIAMSVSSNATVSDTSTSISITVYYTPPPTVNYTLSVNATVSNATHINRNTKPVQKNVSIANQSTVTSAYKPGGARDLWSDSNHLATAVTVGIVYNRKPISYNYSAAATINSTGTTSTYYRPAGGMFKYAVNVGINSGVTVTPTLVPALLPDLITYHPIDIKVPSGQPPIQVPFSSAKCTNLNVDLLDGLDSTQFMRSDKPGINTSVISNVLGNSSIYLNGASGNRIDFNNVSTSSPTYTNIAPGTKIILYPAVSATAVDYAIGIDSNTLWTSVANSGAQFKWYAGTTQVALLDGSGNLTAQGAINSNVAQGTAPINVVSTTVCPNLNAGMVGGIPASGLMNKATQPAFNYYATATTSIQAAWTKYMYDTKTFDTTNAVSNSRFLPLVAGYYQIQAISRSNVNANYFYNGISVNGAIVAISDYSGLAENTPIKTVSALVYLNGTTDWVEINAYSSVVGASLAGAIYCWSGFLVRPA